MTEDQTSFRYDMCMIGMGPVGTISAACIASQGFNVIGVDNNPDHVAAFTNNNVPFTEPGIVPLVRDVTQQGLFRVISDANEAIVNSHIIMIAVGTPTPEESGEPDLSYLENVAKTIGLAFKEASQKGQIVVIRSTVPPGTIRNLLAPIIEKESGLEAGKDFFMASNPEFLREGVAIEDFFDTARIVVGTDHEHAAEAILALYPEVEGERIAVSIESAEFAKYVDNSWHALKIAFANEMGRMVNGFGGNIEESTHIFLSDKKLNISPYYMKPGFAFGGSCLPKDVRGFSHLAKRHQVNVPVINAIIDSNEDQIDRGVEAILSHKPQKVGLLGISFKDNVDDIRESAALYAAAKLATRGIKIMAHDNDYPQGSDVMLPRINKQLSMHTLEDVEKECDVLVLFYRSAQYKQLLKSTKKTVIDLTTTPVDSGHIKFAHAQISL